MIRTIANLPAVMLFTFVATAAPAPKEKGDYYYPTQEGDKRVYEEKGVGDRVRESVEVVMKVEKKDDAFIVTMGREIKGQTPRSERTRFPTRA